MLTGETMNETEILVNNVLGLWQCGFTHEQILEIYHELTCEQEFAITTSEDVQSVLRNWDKIKPGMVGKEILRVLK